MLRIHIINIGCFKNLVDCEKLMKQLEISGFSVEFGHPKQFADIVIINTCGFIGDAEKDSLDLINKYANAKIKKQIGALWVMGCYAQKKGTELMDEISQIDKVYGNFNWHDILSDLESEYTPNNERILTTPAHYAYLKISEGCNQKCSYCIKPILNGPLRSVDIKNIEHECRILAAKGVKELQVVAQNLTSYGLDLYKKKQISELINRIADIKGIEWIRLHYAHPVGFPRELLDTIKERDNVCNYLDMAIQHCSTKMLKLMKREMSKQELTALIQEIRERVPGIFIRTTVMTGHPGETESDFDELYEFVKTQRFERMGVFPYSHEKLSFSGRNYEDEVTEKIKRNRAVTLMELQKKIYKELNDSQIGKKKKVIIDSFNDHHYLARGEHSTPMADPKIVIDRRERELVIGNFYHVELTQTLGKDMQGIVVDKI